MTKFNGKMYLNGELLERVYFEKRRSFVCGCDECLHDIKPDDPAVWFEFPPISENCGGGSFISCMKCVPVFMSEITIG